MRYSSIESEQVNGMYLVNCGSFNAVGIYVKRIALTWVSIILVYRTSFMFTSDISMLSGNGNDGQWPQLLLLSLSFFKLIFFYWQFVLSSVNLFWFGMACEGHLGSVYNWAQTCPFQRQCNHRMIFILKPYAAETRIFWADPANTMAVDTLAPCIIRTSAVMVLKSKDKHITAFHVGWFQVPVPSQSSEII